MHDEILSPSQTALLSLIEKFSPGFGLVGGTAIALHLGHRRSIDFDLFTLDDFDNDVIRNKIREENQINETQVEAVNQLTLVIDNVRVTFYKYPFQISFTEHFTDTIRIPNLETLGAMKAFALAKRAKWKDYVDMYFVFKKISFSGVVGKAKDLFGGEFNEKLFREQLSYFTDIDYSEKIEYMNNFKMEDQEIKRFLEEVSLKKD